jgi:hypothetical protein
VPAAMFVLKQLFGRNRVEYSFFLKQEWMGNTPDLFAMNLGIDSIFKNLLSKKRAFILDGVKE